MGTVVGKVDDKQVTCDISQVTGFATIKVRMRVKYDYVEAAKAVEHRLQDELKRWCLQRVLDEIHAENYYDINDSSSGAEMEAVVDIFRFGARLEKRLRSDIENAIRHAENLLINLLD